jgi:hypothetical protein
MSLAAWKRIPVGTPVTVEVHEPGWVARTHEGYVCLANGSSVRVVGKTNGSNILVERRFPWPIVVRYVTVDTDRVLSWTTPDDVAITLTRMDVPDA